MKSAFRICITSFTLVSVFFLALNCGPLCEADSVGIPTNSESSPCHQDQAAENGPSCDWDSGSLSLEAIKTQTFKLVSDSVFVLFSTHGFENLFKNQFSASLTISCFSIPAHNSFVYLSSVRLLI